MAMDFDPFGWNRRPVYLSVSGVITQMQMMSANGSGYGGCTQMITVEDEVVAPRVEGQMVTVAYFNNVLLAADQSLKLNLSNATEVVTRNNQTFYGNPGGNTLVVLYSSTTRSVPPQTTPDKVIVLCGQ